MPINADFDSLWKNYPKGFSHDHSLPEDEDGERIAKLNVTLRKQIGGKVDNPAYLNLCAVRLSYTLNRSGLKIPEHFFLKWYKADFGVVKGGDGFYYGHGVVEMSHYISEKFGKPDLELKGPFAKWENGTVGGTLISESIPAELKSKKGIILFFVSIWSDAQGHATLWNGETCADNAYFQFANKISFWEVKPNSKPTGVRIQNLNDAVRIIAKPIPEN